jgi:A/G-specific adenine glycosylase
MPCVPEIRAILLSWYDRHRRDLAWRAPPGDRPDAYRVWLSEVMLQQTTVPHATPYFLTFTRRWPTVEALASADEAEVMAAWAGLGYYARARNLLACARAVATQHGGAFPDTEAALRALPGVGAYTAAAVAAIAFDRPANVVDGNVERVMARLHAVETPLPEAKAQLSRLALCLTGEERPGDWAQAVMDLGATVCRPKSPDCPACPLRRFCRALASGDPGGFPRRSEKTPRPRRHGVAFAMLHRSEVALVRRPPRGLLGGMLGLPTTEWRERPFAEGERLAAAPAPGHWRESGIAEHVFTHFSLSLRVCSLEATRRDAGFLWTPLAEARGALPTVFRKALALAGD